MAKLKFLFVLFCSLYALTSLVAQEPKGVDSLRHVLATKRGKDRLPILNSINLAYRDVKVDSGLRYANMYYDLAKSLGDSVEIVMGGKMVSYSLIDALRNDEALKILINILGIAERNANQYPALKNQIKFITNNIGVSYTYIGEYDRALEYQLKSLAIREREGNEGNLETTLHNIGWILYNLNDYEGSLEYYFRAKAIGEKKRSSRLTQVWSNIGLCYYDMRQYENAISAFNNLLKVCNDKCSDVELRDAHSGLGRCYVELNLIDKARKETALALSIAKNQNDARLIAECLFLEGIIEVKSGNLPRAINLYLQSLAILENSHNVKRVRMGLLQQLSECYAQIGNYKEAQKYSQKYIQSMDSLYNGLVIGKIMTVQANYKQRQNMSTINEKNQLLTVKDELISAQQSLSIIFSVIAFLSVAAAILFFRQYSQKKNLNIQLAQANATKDQLFSIIGHDLKSPLASLNKFTTLFVHQAGDLSKEEIKELSKELDKSYKSVYNLLDNLLQWGRSQAGTISFKPEAISINAIVNENLKLFESVAMDKNIRLVNEMKEECTAFAHKNSIDTVVRNLLSNALKFTRPTGVVSVSAQQKNEFVEVSVRDTGIGMSESLTSQLFGGGVVPTSYGTGEEKGTGLGLAICKEFIEKNGGTLSVSSEEGKGSVFSFSIPAH